MKGRHRLPFFLSFLLDPVELVLALASHSVYLLISLQSDLGQLASVVLELFLVVGKNGVERGSELAEFVSVDGYFEKGRRGAGFHLFRI